MSDIGSKFWSIIYLHPVVITCVTSRHGDSSNNEESNDNNKGLHNVGDREVREKLGPSWLVRVICGEDVNDLSHCSDLPPRARDTAVEICAPKT